MILERLWASSYAEMDRLLDAAARGESVNLDRPQEHVSTVRTISGIEANLKYFGYLPADRLRQTMSQWRTVAAHRSIRPFASRYQLASSAPRMPVGAKHLAGAGGRWAKFAEGTNPNALLRETLSSPNASFLPNDAGSFKVVTDLGRVIGAKLETGIRAVVDFAGNVVTWFPVRP